MCREAIGLVKPLILPKLREERDAKKKKRPTKDVITGGSDSSKELIDALTEILQMGSQPVCSYRMSKQSTLFSTSTNR